MSPKKSITFAELDLNERLLLLQAFDYSVDADGFILDAAKARIPSQENPAVYLKAKDAVLAPGSLRVFDSSPTTISKLLREVENNDNSH